MRKMPLRRLFGEPIRACTSGLPSLRTACCRPWILFQRVQGSPNAGKACLARRSR